MRTATIVGVFALLAFAAAQCHQFTWRNLQPDGPWVTDGVSLTTNTACWQGGAEAQLTLKGTVNQFLTSGHVKMQIWEYQVANAVFINNYEYFQCHGGYDDQVCNPCDPLYVTYDNCQDPSSFVLNIPFVLPNKTASGDFTISLISGHYYPKELVIEVAYNFTTSA